MTRAYRRNTGELLTARGELRGYQPRTEQERRVVRDYSRVYNRYHWGAPASLVMARSTVPPP